MPTPTRSIPAPPPAPLHAAMPVPGMVLGGKYRIEEVLGSGGISVVAAAYHLQLRRRVAIKYLLDDALEYPEIVERFTREARAAARIQGEHVARVIDVGVFDGGAPYIVLEYLEGVDLEEYLRQNGALSITRAVRYVLQACEALAEAHAAKIVHRDLKPANLFLAKGPDRRRMVKVLDFGVSKILDEPMTDQRRMLGTVMYMSPEQLHAASEVDLRTDIWSLGVILYELLAGASPFNGPTIINVAQQVEKNSPRPLSELRPDIPAALEAVIARCMMTDSAARYGSVLELAEALAPFVQSRDRESVRTIKGVLQGSIAPPPRDSASFDSGDFSPLSLMPSAPPAPLGSDAPMTTPVESPRADEITRPVRRLRRASWLHAPTTWLAGIAAAAVMLLAVHPIVAPRAPATKEDAVPATSEITLKILSPTPNARVRIDDGPLLPLPLEQSVSRDDREHSVLVEADGYNPQTTKVRFTDDLHIATALSPRTNAPR